MKSNIFKEHKRRNLYKKNEKMHFIKNGFSFIENNAFFKVINQHALKNFKYNKKGLKTRIHNRCILSGRPRSVFQQFKISRNFLRDKGSTGLITGLSKISW